MTTPLRTALKQAAALTLLTTLVGTAGLQTRSAQADTVITAGADKKVKIWSAKDGTLIKEIAAHDGAVNVLALSFDGKYLASGGADKKVKLWNPKDGVLIKEIAAHDGAITSLWFTPEDGKLITGSADKSIKIWTVGDGKAAATVKDAHTDSVIGIMTYQQMIITGGAEGFAKIWDGEGNKLIELEHEGGMTSMTSNIAQVALYTGGKNGMLKWWTQGNGNGDFEGKQGGAIKCIVVSADGKLALTGGADGSVAVWDAEGKKLSKTIKEAHKGGVNAIALTANGKMILTGGADGQVKVWDIEGKLLKTVEKAHEGGVNALIFVPEKKAEAEKKAEK